MAENVYVAELKKLTLFLLLLIQFVAQVSVSEIIFEERFDGTLSLSLKSFCIFQLP